MGVATVIQYELCSYQIRQKINDTKEKEMQREKLSNLEEQLNVYEENSKVLSKYKHDMRHYSRVLNEFLQNEDMQGAKSYIQQLDERLELVTATSYCENRVINGIITIYAARARKIEATFQVQARVPETLKILDIDLTSVLANVLENALEAVEKLPKKERQILVKIDYEKKHLKIMVSNGCSIQTTFLEGGMPVSSKEKQGGLGTTSIRDVAKTYGGYATFSQEKTIFTTKILLNC